MRFNKTNLSLIERFKFERYLTKLTYLHIQNKRAQISINREKEFIKTRHPKENDKEMNHLDRRQVLLD